MTTAKSKAAAEGIEAVTEAPTVQAHGVTLTVDMRELNDARTMRTLVAAQRVQREGDRADYTDMLSIVALYERVFGREGCDALEDALRAESDDGYVTQEAYLSALSEAFSAVQTAKN